MVVEAFASTYMVKHSLTLNLNLASKQGTDIRFICLSPFQIVKLHTY